MNFSFRQFHVERCPPHKRRRRGPRSLQAIMRREALRFTPPVRAHGESGAAPSGALAGEQKFDLLSYCRGAFPVALTYRNSIANLNNLRRLREFDTVAVSFASPHVFSQRVRVWSINRRKLLKRRAELEARLKNSNVDILCLQETWAAEDIKAIPISGSHIIGKLDRTSGPRKSFGGVAVYARGYLADIALVQDITKAERMWCAAYKHRGAASGKLVPSAGRKRHVNSEPAKRDLRLRGDSNGLILLGDVNVHHTRWLQFSNSDTGICECFWDECKDFGLKQLVAKLTPRRVSSRPRSHRRFGSVQSRSSFGDIRSSRGKCGHKCYRFIL